MKQLLIGLSGGMGSGKDTAYEVLQGDFVCYVQRLAFADALKEEVAAACGVTVEFINQNKAVFRKILQWWGTEFRRGLFGENYWVDRLSEKLTASTASVVVITDVRFRNEYDFLKSAGATIWRIDREQPKSELGSHESEALNFPYDIHLNNNSDLARFRLEVGKALKKTIRHEEIETTG